MTDYTKATGSSGTMMIRDTGTTVEFWLKAGSATYNYQLPWKYYVNGVTSAWKSFSFQPGGAWQKLGAWSVTTSQTVTFYLGGTGTSGLGGPTTLSVSINRTSKPPAPKLYLSSYTDTTIAVNSDLAGTGGSAILQWQVGWSTSSTTPSSYKDLSLSNGTGTVTGLARGTTYYLWARARNALGWSAWSNRISAKTRNVPAVPSIPTATITSQTAVTASFKSNGDGGSAILEYQLGYGAVISGPTSTVSSTGTTFFLRDLPPGSKLYFFSRARNAYGWSGWSKASSPIQLYAGSFVDVAGVKKRAVVYVKYNGEWRAARPYVKIAGLWKTTE